MDRERTEQCRRALFQDLPERAASEADPQGRAPPHAARDTSQRPERCAVVPLIGSRAAGSTVRL